MPATFDGSGLRKLIDRLHRTKEGSEQRLSGIADRVGKRFLDDLKARQPIGELDQLVLRGLVNREARPSVRQGLTPIEEGWLGPFVTTPKAGSRVVTISTASEHLEFHTLWTGRQHLGTRKGERQVAQNAKTLAFWWLGEGHWPRSAGGGGFIPQSDFVQDAWLQTKPYLEQEIDGFASYIIENIRGNFVG